MDGCRVSVSAVIVTRGDVDIAPILESLPFDDIVVWDNSEREDLGLYGRYVAIEECQHDLIYVQDDDLLCLRPQELVAHHIPGTVTTNWQGSYDIPFPGRGSVFHRDEPSKVFGRYFEHFEIDRWFTHYGCDGVFAFLADVRVGDFGVEHLPHSANDDRISTSPGWYDDKRLIIKERAGIVKEGRYLIPTKERR